MPGIDPIPPGFHTITPYLMVEGVPKLMDFLARGLGAVETARHLAPGGQVVMHAQMRIGNSMLMMGDVARGGGKAMEMALYLYVPDVDALYARAIAAGGTSLRPPHDEFYGDRVAGVKDPCGNTWWLGSRKEEVSSDEMQRRMANLKPPKADG